MEKKLTEKQLYNMIKEAMSDNTDVVAFCDKKITQLEKKASTSKVNVENENLKKAIIDFLTENSDKSFTATQITKADKIANFELADNKEVTLNKVSALLTILKNEKKIVRVENKKVAYFSIA